jgi:hypothetical protein
VIPGDERRNQLAEILVSGEQKAPADCRSGLVIVNPGFIPATYVTEGPPTQAIDDFGRRFVAGNHHPSAKDDDVGFQRPGGEGRAAWILPGWARRLAQFIVPTRVFREWARPLRARDDGFPHHRGSE